MNRSGLFFGGQKGRAFLFSVLLSLAVIISSPVSASQTTGDITFTTTGQSMWGAGGASTVDQHFTLFTLPWDFGPYQNKSTVNLLGDEYGYDVYGISTGNIGMYFDVNGTAGGIDVTYGGNVIFEYPDPSTFRKGTEVTIKTSFAENQKNIKTSGPRLMADLYMAGYITLDAYMKIIFAGNPTNIMSLNFDSRNSADPDSPYYPNMGFSLFNIDSGMGPDPSRLEIFYPQSFTETSISYELPYTLSDEISDATGVSGTIDLPKLEIDTDLVVDGSLMKASGEDLFIDLSSDLDSYLPIPEPYNLAISGGESGSLLDIVDYSASYDVFNLELGLEVSEKQEFSFDPEVMVNMAFSNAADSSPVDVSLCVTDRGATSDGCLWETASSKNFDVGKDLHVIYPDDPSPNSIKVTPSLSLANTFRNKTWVHFEEPLTFELLKASAAVEPFELVPELCIPEVTMTLCNYLDAECWWSGNCYCWNQTITPAVCTPAVGFDGISLDIGPLWDYTLASDLQKQDLTAFDSTWQLEGFLPQGGNTFDMAPGSCPRAYDGALTITEDIAGTGTLISSAVAGDLRTFAVVSQGGKGAFVIRDTLTGEYTYTPNLNANGNDTFTFRLHDNNPDINCDSNVATITVAITPVNDSPTDISLSRSIVAQGAAAGTVVGTLSALDADTGDTLTFTLTDNAAGRFKITGNDLQVDDGSLLNYSSAPQHNISVRVTDSENTSFDKTFTILVKTVPIAIDGVMTINEDASPTSGVLVATDQDGESLTYSIVTNGQKGTVTITNPSTGAYSCTPSANASGSDTFTFKATDASGFVSNTATVTVTINPLNDGPTDLTITPAVTGTVESNITASDGSAADFFGNSLAVSGDYVISGAPNDDPRGGGSGSAYIFERNADGTFTEKKLVPSDGATGDRFGNSVSISGNYAIVGASNSMTTVQTSPTGCGFLWMFPCYADIFTGSAYVFERNASNGVWDQKAILLASDMDNGDNFGYSVSISGGRAIVGAFVDDDRGYNSGAAYIFERSGGGTWSQSAKLVPADGAAYDIFGYSVSISSDKAVVGAPYDDDKGDFSGAAYIFERSGGGTWSQSAKLVPADGAAYDMFGYSVSVSSDKAVVGAPNDDDRGTDSGSAYLYERSSNGSWLQKNKILASDGAASDYFGRSVSVSGSYIAAGAYTNDDMGSNAGSAYLFNRTAGGEVIETEKLLRSGGVANDNFGYAVSISDDSMTVGVPRDDQKGNDAGSAYVCRVAPLFVPEGLSHGNPVMTSPGGSETGTLVGTINVYDADLDNPDEKSTFTFALTDDAGGRFQVADDQLQVKDASLLDYETNDKHSVTVRVTDISGMTFEKTFRIYVKDMNEAPSAEDMTFTTNEDTSLSASLTAADPNNDVLTYSIIAGPSKGILNLDDTSTGAFTYTPYDNMTGTDSFLFVVSDGQAYSNNAEATITILPVNDAPYEVALAGETKIDDVTGAAGDMFGSSVSLSGSHAVIGAKGDALNGPNSGAAYILERDNDGVWSEIQEIYGGAAGDFAGSSVSVSGDYAFVGAFGEDWISTPDVGAVHVFERSGGAWAEKAPLRAPDYAVQDYFGFSASVSGDRVIIGTPGKDDNGDGSGSAYVYERDPATGWLEKQKLLPSDGEAGDSFGQAVSVSGDFAVVGAYKDSDNGAYSGSAYIFERGTDGIWMEKQKLLASDGAIGEAFGSAVSISGNYAVIGAPYHIDRGMAGSGSAYVFERGADGTWTEVSKLAASDIAEGDWFGSGVSVSGDTIVIGSQKDDGKGSSYLFRREAGGTWAEKQKFVAADRAPDDRFGSSVAVSGGTALIGAHLADGVNADSGAAYFFDFGLSVAENSPTDTYVGTLSGLDIDDGETYTFALLDGAGGRFKVTGNKLLVANGSLLDYEDAASHDIIVRVIDNGGKTYDQTMTIFLIDVYEAPVPTAVSSITRIDSSPTSASSVSWEVTFAVDVGNLVSDNFTLVSSGLGGSPAITDVTGSGTTWTVTASTGTGDGALQLDMTNDAGLVPSASNLPFTGESYLIDRTGPAVSAGPDRIKNTTFTQTATATDANPMTYQWSKESGPGDIAFGTPHNRATTISADADGVYTIRFTAADGGGNSAYAEMTLTWDMAAPVTTAIPSGGVYATPTTVELSCNDGTGSGCARTQYCVGENCSTWKLYSGPITFNGQKYLSYRSLDNAGNWETAATNISYTNCTYSVTPSVITTGWSAITRNFTVITQDGCGWSAEGSDPWLSTSSTGTGSGTGSCSVGTNAGPLSLERTGTITIAGKTITVTQRPVKPAAPGLTSATAGATDVVLTWADNSDNEDGFRVYRRKGIETGWTVIGTEGTGETSHTDTAAKDTTYYYMVSAYNSGGESNSSEVKVATGTVVPPELLTAEALSGTSSELFWRIFDSGEEGYEVWRIKQGEGVWTKITLSPLDPGTAEYKDTTLTENALYLYQICAITTAGGSACSNEMMINGPSDLTLTPTAGGVQLDWADNSTDESGFRVLRRGSTEKSWTRIGASAAETETYLDDTAGADSTYSYRVVGYNDIGSKASDSLKTTTGTLTPPDGLIVTESETGTQAYLNWNDNSTGETGYELWRLIPSDADWKKVKTLGPDATSGSNSHLTAGNLYLYQVCSITAEGGRACSNLSGINGPTDATAVAAAGEVDLSWTDNSVNEAGFNIWRKTPASSWWLIGRTGIDMTTYRDITVVPGEYSYRVCTSGSGVCNASGAVTVTPPGAR